MAHVGLPPQLSRALCVRLTPGCGASVFLTAVSWSSDLSALGGQGRFGTYWVCLLYSSDPLKAPVTERSPSFPQYTFQTHPQSLSEVSESLRGSPILNLIPACSPRIPSNYECLWSMDEVKKRAEGIARQKPWVPPPVSSLQGAWLASRST